MTPTLWSLVQYTTTGEDTRLGIAADGLVRTVPDALRDLDALSLLREWSAHRPLLLDLDVEALTPVDGASLLAPITYPNTVLCAGANYYDHAEEMGTARPDPDAEPFFFLKSPATSVVGPDAAIAIFDDGRSKVDWEAELGVVIGTECTAITAAEAPAHIAGYVVANDISDRGVFHRDNSVFPAFEWDWVGHKSQNGFCPLGPGIVPSWQVPDPQSLKIRLDVNGVVKQDSDTAQMVTGVFDLVAAASRIMTLAPGDIILTGTPAGVGMPRHDFLRDGDVVTVDIDGIGRLTNTIVVK
ncbi:MULTISPECIES: fumarylacetoacetate hydrolase family protein [Rhodococcus]|uniref:fumarylacetoacetate hydrolase family protein n=1 Tax=Rhodococcus TaxID=1827 RepID=UPI00155AA5E7|nr:MULTISPECIES: fumarylacetoacetate hydrolase family protein [Rhodococcus]QQZ14621.1 fumarylacetoacetate hydrolase family protein [Rhodococcus sp. 21391]